jgi:type IV pilus assembly protein PilC
MVKYAYVGTGPAGESTGGVEKAASREAAELALHERDFRDIWMSEKKGFLRADVVLPRSRGSRS